MPRKCATKPGQITRKSPLFQQPGAKRQIRITRDVFLLSVSKNQKSMKCYQWANWSCDMWPGIQGPPESIIAYSIFYQVLFIYFSRGSSICAHLDAPHGCQEEVKMTYLSRNSCHCLQIFHTDDFNVPWDRGGNLFFPYFQLYSCLILQLIVQNLILLKTLH